MRLTKECVDVMFDTLDKREKLIMKLIGEMQILSKTDVEDFLYSSYKNEVEKRNVNVSTSLIAKSLIRLEAKLLVDVKEEGLKRERFLTEEGKYAYNKNNLGLKIDGDIHGAWFKGTLKHYLIKVLTKLIFLH